MVRYSYFHDTFKIIAGVSIFYLAIQEIIHLQDIFDLTGVTNGAISNAAADTLISGLIYHATGQLRILKHNLIHLSQHAEAQVLKESGHMSLEAQETLKAKIIYTKIKNCIKHHDAIIQ